MLMVTAGLVTWNMLNTNKQVQLDPFPRVLYNSILLCPDSGGCLVEAGHGCTQVIAPVAPGHQQNLSQCRWPSVTAAKTSCESWADVTHSSLTSMNRRYDKYESEV